MKNPQIVNIINFIRGTEPRLVINLYTPVIKQLELIEKNNLKATFLLQYDALLDNKYIELMNKYKDRIEVGFWFEVVEQMADKVGVKWNGRWSWDWHSDVGFLCGYMPEERKRLIDVSMEYFKEIFGYYPKSVGSWHIDSISLQYMGEKYGISASCNCKEQYGTDGYTLWGGYYNGAYYPSKLNMLSPAQTIEQQIPVPVFRMLGSDPIYQYDIGLGKKGEYNPSHCQSVATLEPAYPKCGGNPEWIDWYLKENFKDGCLSFGYTQSGQENPFGWPVMEKGLTYQFMRFAQLQEEGKISVQTLEESGSFFKQKYKQTPASAMNITDCYPFESFCESGYKTFWFYNKYFRANLLYQNGVLWFRDIYKFDESFAEKYVTQREDTPNSVYENLPVVDGYKWSKDNIRAGIYFYKKSEKTNEILKSEKITHFAPDENTLIITHEFDNDEKVKITFKDDRIKVESSFDLILKFKFGKDVSLPISSIAIKRINYIYRDYQYHIALNKGKFYKKDGNIEVSPEDGIIEFKI